MDDLVAATRRGNIDECLHGLEKASKITAEPVGYFLSMNIECQDDGSVFIKQQRRADDILQCFKMDIFNSVNTPNQEVCKTKGS